MTPNARIEMYSAAQWWAENRDRDQADRWLAGIENVIADLANDPERHALANEDDDFPFTLRQMLYGLSRRKTHRAVFEVRGEEVIVHAIRHLSQRDLTPDDL
jgi:plasmid stabilization system protein ParE